MTLDQLLNPESVLCNADLHSKKHALEVLSQLLAKGAEELAREEIFASLVERERLGCTSIGKSVAVPHARLEGVEEPIAAVLKLCEPIDFDASDGEPVDLIFGLIVPPDAEEDHVRDLKRITALLSGRELRANLRRADSSRELYETLIAADTGSEPPARASAGAGG